MRVLFPAVLWLAACSTTIEPKNYAQGCTQDSDCVPVYGGDVCALCPCPNAGINAKDQARYQKDTDALRGRCPRGPAADCVQCPAAVPFCLDGTCSSHSQ